MSEAKAEDRARVMTLLIEPVRLAGVRRARGHSVADHDAAMTRLSDRLAYMTEDNLQTLAEVLIDNAPGGMWPGEQVVMGFAHSLQAAAPSESRIIGSWLASVEGPQAEAGGYLVELYRFLRRGGRPPLAMDVRQIKADAASNARRVELTRDRIAREVASAEDREWLQGYLADQQAARAIVEQGARKRADKEGQAA